MDAVLFSAHSGEGNVGKKTAVNEPYGDGEKWYDSFPTFFLLCFSRISFWFYVVVFVVQLIWDTPLDVRVTAVPISLSIFSSAILDFLQYRRKKKFIKKIDELPVTVLRGNEWVDKTWGDIQVGDILKLTNGDVAPADLVVLRTSNGQPVSVETHIIDGSSQWGPRIPPEMAELYYESAIINTSFSIRDIKREKVTDPTQAKSQLTSKYNFSAKLDFGNKSCDLSNKQFIERYSNIFHSGYLVAGVVFTGKDCWTVHNTPSRTKFTQLELKLNAQNVALVLLCVFGSLICALLSFFFSSILDKWPFSSMAKLNYFAQNFRNYLVLLLPFSPLEIYPLIDLIFFANTILVMKSFKKSSIPNIRILDEMTHIDCVITSKSMLLEHKPTLKRVYLNGKSYGKDITTRQLSQNIENDLLQNRTILRQFYDPSLKPNEDTRMFFLHLTLCHSATLVGNSEKFNYVSRFPDDEHLLKLAASAGFMLTGRTETESHVLVENTTYTFKTKRIIHSSLRHPRISIIVEDSEGTIILFTRGVYRVMVPIIDGIDQYESLYDSYHEEGLHVECCSYKYLTPKQYQRFEEKLAEFGDENTDFEFSVVESIEAHAVFLSMFGFEDQPRDGALLFLARAKSGFNQIVLSSQSKGTSLVITAISLGMININPLVGTIKGNIIEDVDISISYLLEEENYDVLIVTGSSIEFLIQSEYAGEVAQLIHNTKMVILQRADQLQASQFIEYLQNVTSETVLAIGHSIYDSVYMTRANVSVAITAENIHPCSVSADIIVNSFDNLCDVIFVEGTYIRERVRSFINYIIPRNMFFAFLQMWYGLYCGFSGTPLFKESDSMALLFFFTLAPFISRSLFNQKVHELRLLSSPTFYKDDDIDNQTKERLIFNACGTMLSSLLLIQFSRKILFSTRTPYTDTVSLPQFSHSMASFFLFGCLGIFLPQCDTWSILHHFIVWGSQILFFTLYRIITEFEISGQNSGTTAQVFSSWPALLLMFISLVFCMFASATFQLSKKYKYKKEDVEMNVESTPDSPAESL